jgi:hypothetical protein
MLKVSVTYITQTVRRPPAFYAHLIEGEKQLTNGFNDESSEGSDSVSSTYVRATQVLQHQHKYTSSLHTAVQQNAIEKIENIDTSQNGISKVGEDEEMTPALSSSSMTQIQLTKGDEEISSLAPSSLFPLGVTDTNGQQVDLRRHNSWTMRLHEVSTPELAEVFAINAIAPAIINAKLKPLMERDKEALKFIVNVSAMEGRDTYILMNIYIFVYIYMYIFTYIYIFININICM